MSIKAGKKTRSWLLPVLAAAAVAAFLLSPWGEPLRSAHGRAAAIASLDRAVRDAGPLAPLLYLAASAAGMCFLPATPFLALGALLFGKAGGALLAYLAAVVSATASFFLGRYLFRDAARELLAGRLPGLEEGAQEHGFRVILLLRLLWFPFIVLNWAAGATAVSFRSYILATVLGELTPMVTATWLLGAGRELLATWTGPRDLLRADVVAPLAFLVASILVPLFFERRRKAAIRKVEERRRREREAGGVEEAE